MDFIEHALRIRLVLFRQGAERVHETLVLARRQQTALDADLFHDARKAEAIHQHADGADHAGLVDVDAVGGGGDVIAARGAHFIDHHIQGLVRIALAQALHLVDDHAGLHGTAARTINVQHHGHGTGIGKRLVQRGDDDGGRAAAFGLDGAADVDQGRVAAQGLAVVGRVVVIKHPQGEQHDQQAEDLEKDAPAAVRALLLQSGKYQLFQHGALPVPRRGAVAGGWRAAVQLVIRVIAHGSLCLNCNNACARLQAGSGWTYSSGCQYSWPSRSLTGIGRRRPPLQGPPAHRPLSGT